MMNDPIRNFVFACVLAGLMHRRGEGTPKDHGRAAKLFEGACDQHSASGCYHLGEAYRDGLGVQASASLALGFFERACQAGRNQACAVLREQGEP